MTRNELNAKLCAVKTTLDEVPAAAESTLYMGMGCDMATWETVRSVLVAGNLATIEHNEVKITAAGHAMAEKINAFAGR